MLLRNRAKKREQKQKTNKRFPCSATLYDVISVIRGAGMYLFLLYLMLRGKVLCFLFYFVYFYQRKQKHTNKKKQKQKQKHTYKKKIQTQPIVWLTYGAYMHDKKILGEDEVWTNNHILFAFCFICDKPLTEKNKGNKKQIVDSRLFVPCVVIFDCKKKKKNRAQTTLILIVVFLLFFFCNIGRESRYGCMSANIS